MPLNRWLAAANRRATNQVMRPLARRLPGFGVIAHTGRRSHRPFATPVNVFRTADGYVIALTYGAESDWVKNVVAAGGCELVTHGRRVHLTAPEIFHDERRAAIPAPIRPALRLLGVADFIRLTARRAR